MSLKRKIALNLSIAFSLLFGLVMTMVYVSFDDFREQEFESRFKQRLKFTINFIKQSKNFEEEAPLFFNENSDNVLLNEEILIFNSKKELVYSTIKDRNVSWDSEMLTTLDKVGTIYNNNSTPEIYAALRYINGQKYYILTTAFDKNGQSKLSYLKYILLFCYLLSVLLIWIFSYYIVSKFLKPLENLNKEISQITEHKLTTEIQIKNSNDEISILAKSFNTMIGRLHDAFQSQKEFTSSASHEIRTPITRMSFALENLVSLEKHSPQTMASLWQMQQDVSQLKDLTDSLLLLTKFDKDKIQSIFEEIRIDEVVFEAYEKVEKSFPQLKMDFSISEETSEDAQLVVNGVKSLLEIVFINLFKNAAKYSFNPEMNVEIKETSTELTVNVSSQGNVIPSEEVSKLFHAFARGSNAQNISGSGLGLRISQRILEYHDSQISYFSPENNTNVFTVIFPKD